MNKGDYKLTEVGVIPEDWGVKNVKEAYEICNNLRFPISADVRKSIQGNYPYYGPTKIQDYINEYRVEGEFALIGEDGDHFLKWRSMPMTLLAKGKFNVNNHAHLIKGVDNNASWFYYFFKHRDITKHLSRQGAGRYKLNKRTLEVIPIALPPTKAEQTAIATALSDADALIQSLEKLIAKKQSIKQGAMQALLTGKKRLPGFSGEWEVKRLGEILTYEQPTKYLVKDTEYNDNNDVAVLTANKSFILGYTNEDFGVFTNFPVIIFDDFTTASRYVYFPFKVKSSAIKILKERSSKFDLRFVYEKVQTIKFSLGDHKRYWISEYQNIEVEIPSLEEQSAIAHIISNMDAEIVALEQKLAKSRQIKQGMMQELLTGKTRLI